MLVPLGQTPRLLLDLNSHVFLRLGLWLVLAVTVSASQPATALTARERTQGYREHRILAKPRADLHAFADEAENRMGMRLRRAYPRMQGLRVLELSAGDSADQAIARLRATGQYEFVERDFIVRPFATPNDTRFSEQWALHNGASRADINAIAGWDTLTNASSVKVAVIDSGIRLSHEDFAGNLWSNIRGTPGIDATVSKTSASYYTPTDATGHGSHVSGIIGAAGNNGIGVSGVAWRVQLMALKFIPDEDGGSITDEIECIDYAIDNGAEVINASFGGGDYSASVFLALQRARDAGIIVVAAAGNDGADNDAIMTYPSGYLIDNIVSVAATTRTDALWSSSNYGSGAVDLAAPGVDVLSTYYTASDAYRTLSGTSMSAPHVTGAVALLRAKFPSDTYRQTINRLLRGTKKVDNLNGKVQTGGRLDLAKALTSTTNRPFNDDFAERAVVSGANVRIRASSTGGTAEAGEPAHAGLGNSNSVWWTWTATDATEVSFDTTGSSYDTLLAVYTGNALGALQQAGANDNAGTNFTTSRVVLSVQANTAYHIAVAGKGSANGLTVLRIGSIPVNDTFSQARAVEGKSVKVTSLNRNASIEAGEPRVTGASGRTVWYSWVAPTSGTYHCAAFATEMDTVAAVYTGSSVANLTRIAFNNNSSASNTDALVRFEATAGTTYYIQIDDANTSSMDSQFTGAEFTLTLTDSTWEFPTHDQITSSPAVGSDGTIYFGAGSDKTRDTAIYAVNTNGTQKWRYAVGAEGIIGASPAIGSDGTVYIGSMDSSLYAIDGSTGARKWSYAASSPIYAAPAIATNGTIYFRDDLKLYALSSSGALKWSYTINTPDTDGTYCSPVVGVDGTVYIGNTAGKLYALTDQGTSATLRWTYEADGDIYTTPAIGADGTLYFGTLTGAFYAVTPGSTSATKKWSIKLPTFQGADASISSSPALAPDGTIYFAAYDHKLYALNPQNGATKWTFPLGDEVRASSPAIARDGTVFVGVYDGLLYAVRADGSLLRTFPSAGWIRSSPVIAGERIYFGSNDAKLHAFDLGQGAASSAWPMFQHDVQHSGRARAPGVTITAHPQSQSATGGATVSLSVGASANGSITYEWLKDGVILSGKTGPTLTLNNLAPADAGLYSARVTSETTQLSNAAIVGVTTTGKILGAAREVGSNITLPTNGNTYDQILLEGTAASVTADSGQITRISFIDLSDDIVQVEFSGAGTLTLQLDNATGPAAPINYNQSTVAYRRGHARIILSGADATTNVMVYSVGTLTAVNQELFRSDVVYDGTADIASLAILSTDSGFASIRTANTTYLASSGITGIYAPGVRVSGPVYVGDINAGGEASPVLILGSAALTQINGGNLLQLNGRAVRVSGINQLQFVEGTTSHGARLPAQSNQGRLEEDGQDVTAQVVKNPSP